MSAHSSISKIARVALAALTFAAFTTTLAQARPGGGFSSGSRGVKTYTAPPTTRTAPNAAQPMQRSAQPAQQTAGAAKVGAPATAGSRFGTGFMGGLLGAGLIGALFGAGFFGGMGGLMGFLGLILQAALIGGVIYFAISFFRRRNQPATATPSGNGYQRASLNEVPRGAAGGTAAAQPAGVDTGTQPIKIEQADYASFERLLSVVQLSFSREDTGALRSATTAEMLGYFTEQLEVNSRNGVRNELGQPVLVSGDLAESWREASGEYATVAMKYTLTDAMVDRTSGRVVEGSKSDLQEITELWTFTRRVGGGANSWRLSAIQQTG
ncbi:MAG: TIM44-like domain-containing protein [Hyphomicrobiaceae bacterium]